MTELKGSSLCNTDNNPSIRPTVRKPTCRKPFVLLSQHFGFLRHKEEL